MKQRNPESIQLRQVFIEAGDIEIAERDSFPERDWGPRGRLLDRKRSAPNINIHIHIMMSPSLLRNPLANT